jgi:hypothetical protein
MNKRHIENLAALAAALPDRIAQLDAAKNELDGNMRALKEQGLIYASEHMKDGKYLVLVYPMQPGKARKREYVGKDPQKMQEARAAIQRGKDYDMLAQRSKRLESILSDGLSSLQDGLRALTRAI